MNISKLYFSNVYFSKVYFSKVYSCIFQNVLVNCIFRRWICYKIFTCIFEFYLDSWNLLSFLSLFWAARTYIAPWSKMRWGKDDHTNIPDKWQIHMFLPGNVASKWIVACVSQSVHVPEFDLQSMYVHSRVTCALKFKNPTPSPLTTPTRVDA